MVRIVSLRQFDCKLSQVELNGGHEPVVAEKLSHSRTWSSCHTVEHGPALTQSNMVQLSHSRTWSSSHTVERGPALTQSNVVQLSHSRTWSSSHTVEHSPALTQSNMVQLSHSRMWSSSHTVEHGPALTQSNMVWWWFRSIYRSSSSPVNITSVGMFVMYDICFFFSPIDWNNFYCKTFDHCTLFCLKIWETTVYISGP